MPKKQWTEEERKAFGEKMRQKRLEKEQTQTPSTETEAATPVSAPTPTNAAGEQDIATLQRQILELQQLFIQRFADQAQPSAVSAANGKLVGTMEKYATDKELYPDPSARLSHEPRLARFAFDVNYELRYEVTTSEYTTIDNIRVREPKFSLTLVKIVIDEETGEATNGRYDICNLVFHEDPDTARFLANRMDFDFNTVSEKEFLDEMRYLRMRDWLVECFYPTKPKQAAGKRDIVVGGRLVQFYEVSDDDNTTEKGEGVAARIDFNKVSKF